MKISEIFKEAIAKGIPQIKGNYYDGKGGFCASGLLQEYVKEGKVEDNSDVKFRDYLAERKNTSLPVLNDNDGLSWEQFANLAEECGF